MRIICEHCQQICFVDDQEVKEYASRVPVLSIHEAQAARAKKPRPGSSGANNWRNKRKEEATK